MTEPSDPATLLALADALEQRKLDVKSVGQYRHVSLFDQAATALREAAAHITRLQNAHELQGHTLAMRDTTIAFLEASRDEALRQVEVLRKVASRACAKLAARAPQETNG